jgi:hypothetical protein
MKGWQRFAIGTAMLCLVLLLFPLMAYIAVFVAMVMVATVIVGFLLVPDRDSWIVWVTQYSFAEGEDDDIDVFFTQEPIAIQAYVTRLWILYIPTIMAVGFLMFVAARDIWSFDITTYFSPESFFAARVGVGVVWFLLAGWLYERWLLRRAAAASTREEREGHDYFTAYYFVVEREYHGGLSFPLFSYYDEPALAQVVMYRRTNPSSNRLVRAFLFHGFKVIGRGVQDLDVRLQYATQPATNVLE